MHIMHTKVFQTIKHLVVISINVAVIIWRGFCVLLYCLLFVFYCIKTIDISI